METLQTQKADVSANLPDYSKSQKLSDLKRYLCQVTSYKPRLITWLVNKVCGADCFYSSKRKNIDRIKEIVKDPRTPLKQVGDRVENTKTSYGEVTSQ